MMETELFSGSIIGNNLELKLKKNIFDMSDEEFAKLGISSSISSAIIFEVTKSQGTNIIIDEDSVKVISRKVDDKLSIGWNPINLDQNELQDSFQKITNSLKPVEKIESAPIPQKKEPENIKYDESNYMVRHLKRKA